MGYAGGVKDNPTYHDLGDHSEAVQIEYDPTVISYDELLEVFWDSHNPTYPAWSTQYKSAIFYHDEEQQQLATASQAKREQLWHTGIYTEIAPLTAFYPAEDYHQKYYLRQVKDIAREYQAIYPDTADFTASTAVARTNGYIAGYGSPEQLEKELDKLGLSEKASQRLLDIARRNYH